MGDEEKGSLEGHDADVEDFECDKTKPGFFKHSNDKTVSLSNPKTQASTRATEKISMPKTKRLVRAMKKIQYDCTQLEAQFFKEVHLLECKFSALYAPYYEKRMKFLTGELEPTDEDCDFPSDFDIDEDIEGDQEVKPEVCEDNESLDNVKGIPGFWLTTFNNIDLLGDMIQPHDEPILQHLKDIRVSFSEADPMGFCLEFHFEPNEYFENSVLVKKYDMKCVVDEEDPFSFDGPEIYRCEGSKIDWKPGRDVTVQTITKKQKHKNSGSIRTIKKTVLSDSFFNFFNPPTSNQDPNNPEIDSVTQDLLSADFEIGHFIRERLIPRAVLFYTGEAVDLDEDLDCEDEDEEYVEDVEDEEESE